jgi:hypothetical protein
MLLIEALCMPEVVYLGKQCVGRSHVPARVLVSVVTG